MISYLKRKARGAFLVLINLNKHIEIEEKYGCRKNSLRKAVRFLAKKSHDIDGAVVGCEEYCRRNGNNFEVAFNLYVSCLKNPKKN